MRVKQFFGVWIDFDHVLAIEPVIAGNGQTIGVDLWMMFKDSPVRLIFWKAKDTRGNVLSFQNETESAASIDEVVNFWKQSK